MGNFRVNFRIINRHLENKKIKDEIISATGPIGVNIYIDFLTYTELSKKCFRYLLRKAVMIYKEKVGKKRR